MNFDLKQMLDRLDVDKWDLQIVVEGVSYPVREFTLEEFTAIASAEDRLTQADEIEVVRSMFIGDAPDVAAWPADLRDAAFNVLSAYVVGYVQKKRASFRQQVADAMALAPAKVSTSGRR